MKQKYISFYCIVNFLMLICCYRCYAISISFETNKLILQGRIEIITSKYSYTCDSIYHIDNQTFCEEDVVVNIIHDNEIKKIIYNGIKIYPQKFQDDTVKIKLQQEDCEGLAKNLLGNVLIHKNRSAIIILGILYQKGICVSTNLKIALKLYKLGGVEQNIINKLEAQIKKYELERKRAEIERLRQEEERKRQLLLKIQRIKAQCQTECLVNPYQYNVSCYRACLNYHGLY